VYFKPSRKNKDFGFLPVPIVPVGVKIGHLNIWVLFLRSKTLQYLLTFRMEEIQLHSAKDLCHTKIEDKKDG
jgi:hypothetical protein